MTCDCLCTPWAAWLRAEYRNRGHPGRKKVAGGSPQIPKAMLCLPNIRMVARVASVFVSRHYPNFPLKTFGFREAKLATPYLPPENNHLLLFVFVVVSFRCCGILWSLPIPQSGAPDHPGYQIGTLDNISNASSQICICVQCQTMPRQFKQRFTNQCSVRNIPTIS